MPLLNFHKYEGCGNDFVIVDNRSKTFSKNDTKLVHRICDRRFGIGADGLILLETDSEVDFTMVYFNSDGHLGSMCGNGGRCIVAFAASLGIIGNETTFRAADGLHQAWITEGGVRLGMSDVHQIRETSRYQYLDTGSPHHVQLVEDLQGHDVRQHGAMIRYGLYGMTGSNINFVAPREDGSFAIRTYERGVEDETLACGTGVTAVALAMHQRGLTTSEPVTVHAQGGTMQVGFQQNGQGYTGVTLEGPATFVFKGSYPC